jgi:hypothetical protein
MDLRKEGVSRRQEEKQKTRFRLRKWVCNSLPLASYKTQFFIWEITGMTDNPLSPCEL